MKREDTWFTLADRWQSQSQGGWLVVMHWGRESWATPWREVTDVTFEPAGGRRGQPVVVVAHNGQLDRFPAHELAAQRLRHWWCEAQAQRSAVPRWCDVDTLMSDPRACGGRRWMSRLVLAVGPKEACALGGRDIGAAHRTLHRLGFASTTPELRQLLEGDLPGSETPWQLHEGVATYVFEWQRVPGGREGRLVGVLNIERFRAEVGAPMAPSGGTARTG